MEKNWQREAGRELGRAEGRAEHQAKSIRRLCAALGLEWSRDREERIAGASADELERLEEHLATHRDWPS